MKIEVAISVKTFDEGDIASATFGAEMTTEREVMELIDWEIICAKLVEKALDVVRSQ